LEERFGIKEYGEHWDDPGDRPEMGVDKCPRDALENK